MKVSRSLTPLWGASSFSSAPDLTRRDMIWDFNQITPSTTLDWQPCFGSFTCTRLQVPLDYSNPSAGTTAIALVKHSAPNTTAETQDIIFNPGGPGESSVGIVLGQASRIRGLLGNNHNLIGMDPRGVNNTGPSLDCFPNDATSENIFDATFTFTVDSQDPSSLAKQWAIAGAFGDWCSNVHKNDSARYANTVAVAQDMLRYVDTLHNSSSDGKLWYYGVSYGSVLGATFAALYPDRIGRLIIDGVEDSEDYYAGTWKTNLVDTDKVTEAFFTYCYEAGPTKCPFYAASPQEIEERLLNVTDMIRREPVPVSDPAVVSKPLIIRYEDLITVLSYELQSPLSQFPQLAQILADLETRDGSSIAPLVQEPSGLDPGTLIWCMDAVGRYNLSTISAWTEHVDLINTQSRFVADAWSSYPLMCRQLTITPPPDQQFFGTPSANKTSFPIMFVANTGDPLTPLAAARKMQSKFPGSALLVQNSQGHVSVSSPSNCTSRFFQEYLAGTPPPPGTTCQPNSLPFGVSQNADGGPARRGQRGIWGL